MEKVYTNSDYSSQILSQISELWRGNKYCDAVLNLQDEKFKLHKLVLMAACPNILRCLAHTEENNIFEFYLPEDSEKSVVMPVVNYLYIGSIQLNMTNVYGIEKLAKQLRLSTLSQFCHDFISLLESETFSQSSLQPGINQENIPKQESTEVEKIVDPKTIDALINSANATLREINTGASSLPELTDVFGQVSCLPQSTDGIGQLPFASKSIKTELDTFISPTLEETISMNEEKTITIEPLNNILQFSKSDNYMTTALATSSACKSYDSATLDIRLGSGRLEPDPFSHQTASNGTLNPQINSCQVSTSTRFTPELNIVACKPSTSQSQGGEGDDIDLVMTAEDENFDDSDDEWVPKGNESSDSDFYPESALDRSTKTKRTMSTKGPKAKKSKKNDSLTAKKKKVRGDKMRSEDDESKKTLKPSSLRTSKGERCSRFGRGLQVDLTGETEHVHEEVTNKNDIVADEGSLNPGNKLSTVSPQMDGLRKKSHCSEIPASSNLPDKEIESKDNASTDQAMVHSQDKSTEESSAARKENNLNSASADNDEEKRKQIEYKLIVVEHAQSQGVKSAAELFNITEDIIEDWIMLKQHFKKKTKEKKKAVSNFGKQQQVKLGEHTDLEDRIVNWLLATDYSIGHADDVNVIGNRAAEIAQEIGKPNLKIGEYWVKQMLERYISTCITKIDDSGDVCTHELRKEVSKYATEHGTRAAAEHYGLTTAIVGCWKKNRNLKTFDGNSSAEPSVEITRKRYTISFKLEAVKCAEQLSNRAASRLYGVNEKRVRDWRKQKEELERSQGSQWRLQPVQNHRPYSLLESLLADWIIKETRKITIAEIRAKALLIAEQTNSPEFKASNSWFNRFMKLHKLQEYVKLESSKEKNFVFEKRKEVAESLTRDSRGRFLRKRGKEADFTNEFKLNIIEFAERSGNEEAEQQYGIKKAQIRDWRVQKSSLLQRIKAKNEDKEGET
ncbi:hypothetical protein ACJMK2_020829 [Sinanodonta woodiana]|uniref:Uncharacterized protein n=1 Tax=Sinanodonta woodiana TaxID=1069815 RepID=A0ABD3U2W6_SINWO